MSQSLVRGPLAMLAAVLFASVMFAFTKMVGKVVPGEQIVLIRYFVGILVCILAIKLGWGEFRAVNRKLLVVRGVTGGAATTLLFVAIASKEKLANVIALMYTFPAFAAVFSHFFINERLSPRVIVLLLLTLSGMSLICKPGFDSISGGELAAIGGAFFSGIAVVTIRKLRETDSTPIILLSLCIFGALLTSPVVAVKYQPCGGHDLAMILLVGLFAAASQLLMTYSFKYCKATEGSIIMMLQIVIVTVMGYLFFGESPDAASLIGAGLILASGTYLVASRVRVELVR